MTQPYDSRIKAKLAECYATMPIMPSIIDGSASITSLQQFAQRHYAEIRAFLDVKLPLRLSICPYDAFEAKRYFSDLYIEEQGSFSPGDDHANLFLPICAELGLKRGDLEREVALYASEVRNRFATSPSMKEMVKELSYSFAWESFTGEFGDQLITSLHKNYSLSVKALHYFIEHNDADESHSSEAFDTLSSYVTSEELLNTSLVAIEATLTDDIYLLWRLESK